MQSNKLYLVFAVAGLSLVLVGAACNKNTVNQKTESPSGSVSESAIVNSEATTKVNPVNTQAGTVTIMQNTATIGAAAPGQTKTFNVEGGIFYFNPKEIRVKKGDTVKIVFTNKEGFHDWVVDEFNARTAQITAGQTQTIEFVADKTGTFEYYCSVGNHRAMGMKGNLVVE